MRIWSIRVLTGLARASECPYLTLRSTYPDAGSLAAAQPAGSFPNDGASQVANSRATAANRQF